MPNENLAQNQENIFNMNFQSIGVKKKHGNKISCKNLSFCISSQYLKKFCDVKTSTFHARSCLLVYLN